MAPRKTDDAPVMLVLMPRGSALMAPAMAIALRASYSRDSSTQMLNGPGGRLVFASLLHGDRESVDRGK